MINKRKRPNEFECNKNCLELSKCEGRLNKTAIYKLKFNFTTTHSFQSSESFLIPIEQKTFCSKLLLFAQKLNTMK